jgi:hypothetical protein
VLSGGVGIGVGVTIGVVLGLAVGVALGVPVGVGRGCGVGRGGGVGRGLGEGGVGVPNGGVGGGVGVGVAVGVPASDSSALGAIAREELITAAATATTAAARIANIVAGLIEPFVSLCHYCVENKRGRILRVKYWSVVRKLGLVDERLQSGRRMIA